ncbi:MAG: hypothetical protein PSV24_14460 [Rhodoferax sp.]|nr:hypothetical protein [Rhodoferax sp.]
MRNAKRAVPLDPQLYKNGMSRLAGVASFSVVPDQDVVLFAQCGHWPQWEQADKFNGLVTWFLTRD